MNDTHEYSVCLVLNSFFLLPQVQVYSMITLGWTVERARHHKRNIVNASFSCEWKGGAVGLQETE